MSKITLYQKTRLGKTQQWTIWVEPKGNSGYPEVWIEHGLSDGKKQTTFDVIDKGVNEGKANETTPLQQAKLVMERKITKQKEHGYSDNLDNALEEKGIDFNQPMPKELCFYKPKNSIDEKKITSLEKAKSAIYTVKRDGMMHVIRKTEKFGVEIYTRTMDLVSDKYPHLMEALSKLDNGTILLGELILEKEGRDNFNNISSICRSDPEESLLKQKELGQPIYYAFDIAFVGEKNLLISEGFSSRLQRLRKLEKIINNSHFRSVEVIDKPHAEALQKTKDRKLEGLVVWDANSLMESGGDYTFNGKAYRPNVLWKSKPKYEDDFIVRWDPSNKIGDFGKGKNKDRVGKVFIYQLDDNGNEVWLGRCGGGLTDKDREFYTNVSLFPRVWKIEFDSIQPKTGALRYPVFNLDRTLTGDKTIKECMMSDAVIAARNQEEDEDEQDSAETEKD